LGINTFFTGSTANDIAVNQAIANKPQMLAAARNGQPTDNQTALAIAKLSETGVKSLGGATLSQSYDALVTGVGAAASSASVRAEASTVVLETLTAQREGLSGVSLDEEAVKLVAQQRSFQSAAQLISTIDDLLDIVISLGR
jgi:flagellar hook-associated protein 1 FlgK